MGLRKLSPRLPYKRQSSNASRESAPEADQPPLRPLGEPLYSQTAPRTSEAFDRARQTRSLLVKEILRWIGTVIFTALIVVILRV